MMQATLNFPNNDIAEKLLTPLLKQVKFWCVNLCESKGARIDQVLKRENWTILEDNGSLNGYKGVQYHLYKICFDL